MQLCLLHLDDALRQQEGFMRTCESTSAIHVEAKRLGQAVRLWSREPTLEKLSDVIMPQIRTRTRPPRLVFMGSSDFHHVSALLIANILQQTHDHITVLQFDSRPAWRKFGDGMHCHSWLNRVLEHPQITRAISIGAVGSDLVRPEWKRANLVQMTYGALELYPFEAAPSRVGSEYGPSDCFDQQGGALHWKTIAQMGEPAFTEHLLARIPTNGVYLSIDKNVLASEDAIVNGEQGKMPLTSLLTLIRRIGAKHRIIGADVVGDYSPPVFSGDEVDRWRKQAEIYRRAPRELPNMERLIATNSATNHALFALLTALIK